MSLLTVVLVLAMLLWAVGFVVIGLLLAERSLLPRSGDAAPAPVSSTRKFGAIILMGIAGLLVGTALVTGFLVAERESHLDRLGATVSQLESRIHLLDKKMSQELSELRRSQTGSR